MTELLATLIVLAAGGAATVWAVRNRRKIRAGVALGAVFLGVGYVVDPPQQQMLEATEARKKKGSPENGEPLDGDEAI